MADTPPGAAFSVVPAEVRDAGKFVQMTATALVNGIRSADSEINGLMTTWKGTAADSYLSGWEETKKGALEVLDSLATMADLLGVVAVSYADVDDRAAGSIGGALNMDPDTFHTTPTA
ncbi:WXG100 family type VII secretion target [Nocardia sp. AB354]|uniref:WXG100 family type VII secretion target n=1 Tax=Nocardia sp. AB354 TaxID=3413283 RepID=UPI003C1E46B7